MNENIFQQPSFSPKPNLGKRFFAAVIDYGLILSLTWIYIMYFGHDNDPGGKTVDGLPALVTSLGWFLYFVCVEAYYGASLGHIAFNLQVLQRDRKQIGLSNAFKRHLLDPFDFFFFGIPAIIAIKSSDRHQRLGDMLAGTIVIDKTDPDQYYQMK